jgi:hypothetical protein
MSSSVQARSERGNAALGPRVPLGATHAPAPARSSPGPLCVHPSRVCVPGCAATSLRDCDPDRRAKGRSAAPRRTTFSLTEVTEDSEEPAEVIRVLCDLCKRIPSCLNSAAVRIDGDARGLRCRRQRRTV